METSNKMQKEQCFKHCVQKKIINPGIWGERPRDFAFCMVKISDINFNGNLLENRNKYFQTNFNGVVNIGEADNTLDKVLETCLKTMLIGEESHVTLNVPVDYTKVSETTVSSVGVLNCVVYLKDCKNEPPIHEWSDEKKYDTAMNYKVKGVTLFKEGFVVEAFFRFSKAFKIVVSIAGVEELTSKMPEAANILTLRVTLLNNMASCHLQRKNFEYALQLCEKVLQIEPHNVKALYRHAIAAKELQNYVVARDDLKILLQVEPSNTAAKEKYKELKYITKEMDEKYSVLVKNMFQIK